MPVRQARARCWRRVSWVGRCRLPAIKLRVDPAMRQRHQRDEEVDRLGCDYRG